MKTPTLKVTRLVLAITLVVVAGILVIAAFQLEGGGRGSELLMGLATEVFGIIVTLAVVDWMLERRRRQERARDLAWATLHSVERAVWVWQGGPRRVSTDELLGIVQGIDATDELQPFARSLLAAVGTRSLEILDRSGAELFRQHGRARANGLLHPDTRPGGSPPRLGECRAQCELSTLSAETLSTHTLR